MDKQKQRATNQNQFLFPDWQLRDTNCVPGYSDWVLPPLKYSIEMLSRYKGFLIHYEFNREPCSSELGMAPDFLSQH